MNQLTLTQRRISARFVALVTMMAMLLSAFPVAFFVANAATPEILFSEDFESDLSQWATVGSNWSIIGAGGGSDGSKLRMTGAVGATGNVISEPFSTVGYEDIKVSIDYRGNLNGEPTDDLISFIYNAGTGNINITSFNSVNAGGSTWESYVELNLNDADDAAAVELLFSGIVTAESDTLNVDNIVVTGVPIESHDSDDAPEVIAPEDESVRPLLECWVDNGDQTGTAYFGYLNENGSTVNIPVGNDNKFTGPNAPDEGQTTEFAPGRTDYVDDAGVFKPGNAAFSVDFDLGSNKVWTLTGPDGSTRTATAGTGGPQCPEPAPTGEIRVCKLIADEQGNLTDGAAYDEDFTITLDLEDSDFETTVDFSTALTLDTDLVTDNGDQYDAECVLVGDLAPGNYYYAEEPLDSDAWESPLYHDNHNAQSDELSDFGELAPEGTPGEKNNDGSIRLEADETRTLAVLNTKKGERAPEPCSLAGEAIDFTLNPVQNNGNPVKDSRRDVTALETIADSPDANFFGKEDGFDESDFFSLGIEGFLEYEFTDKIAIDGPGDDIAIWETTGGTSGQSDEKAEVFFSEDGVNYVSVGVATGDASFDISGTGLDFVKFVRLEDQSSGVQGGNGDGFDVDAITIIDGSCEDYLTINATKIVCEDEADLPNYGTGGPNMDAQTALDWVAEDNTCEIVEDWNFEWAPKNANNPDDDLPDNPFYGPAGGDWTSFNGSVVLPLPTFDGMKHLWVREELKDGYIPFTFGPGNKTNADDVSAEFYCHTDVLNYDNYDRLDNPEAGGDYYCVGWNAPQEDPEVVYQCEAGMLFLDTETNDPEYMSLYTVDETNGAATFFADYDLNLFPVLAVDEDETVYSITEDGDLVSLDNDGGDYTEIGDTGIAEKKPVAMEFAPDGTLYVLTENNDALYEINTFSGSASLLAELDLNVTGGDVVFEDDDIVYLKNSGEVYAIDDSSYFESLLGTLNVGSKRITSAATKDGSHYAYTREDSFHPFTLDPFTQEAIQTNTGPFAWGDGSFCPVEEREEVAMCELELLSDNETFIEENNDFAVATFDGNNAWTAEINGDSTDPTWIWESYEVADPEATTTRTFIDTFEVTGGQNAKLEVAADNSYIAYLNGEIVIDQSDAANNFASLSQDEVSGAVLDDELVDGLNTLKIVVTNNGREGDNYTQNPAGVLYRLTLEGDRESCEDLPESKEEPKRYLIDGYKYEVDEQPQRSLESLSLPNTRSGWEIELYDGEGNLLDATSTDAEGYYYFYVPAGDYEVKEVMKEDWTQIGVQDGEDYIYPDGEAHSCEFTLPMEYQDDGPVYNSILLQLEGEEYTYSDYRCDFFNEFLGEDDDEEEEEGEDPTTSTRGGGNDDDDGGSTGQRFDTASAQPLIAGIATSEPQVCPFLEDHMQIGWENNAWEVTKLQLFLNAFRTMFGGTENPVTGEFDRTTDANVKAFQEYFRSEVLDPWYERNIVPHNRPTGFVYKTTKWKINSIICPEYAEYPSFEGENLTENIDNDVDR